MKRTPERRSHAANEIQLRERPDRLPTIYGYAVTFNALSEIMTTPEGRAFREIVRPGAFADSIRSRADILARFDHETILGRSANGTLRLTEDERGLRYEIDPANTSYARDLIALIERRDVTGSSFAFNVRPKGDVWRREGEQLIRELRSVKLVDVSPVVRPTYSATTASLVPADLQPRHKDLLSMRLALAERI